MIYPFNLLGEEIYPLLGGEITKLPIYVNMSSENSELMEISRNETQREFDAYVFGKIKEAGAEFALSNYLENRSAMLCEYPQMVAEKRYYHLGLDVSAPLGTKLYAPLDGIVTISEYEEGEGNYGGMVVLEHDVGGLIFYSLYGHLNLNSLPNVGDRIKKGDNFAAIGDFEENGNWFRHTHLQVLTEAGYRDGWTNKGYCSEKDIPTIGEYCPSPTFLFRLAGK